MTEQDKQLLLKDLCARLPYGVIAYASEINKNGTITDVNIPYNMVNLTVDNANGKYELVPLSDIKPYLRPMSSMTEEEEKEFNSFVRKDFANSITWSGSNILLIELDDFLNWLNTHHFDYHRLIERGFAFEALEGMYKSD